MLIRVSQKQEARNKKNKPKLKQSPVQVAIELKEKNKALEELKERNKELEEIANEAKKKRN